MVFEGKFIAKSLDLTWAGPSAHNFDVITTDSRQVKAGSLFVALKGDNFDGHDFIERAVSAGAAGVLCHYSFAQKVPTNVAVFAVEDTLVAYRQIAAAWRRRFEIPVIAIAGSVGKTTTKEFLAAILGGKWVNVLKTKASQNGFIGIPMTLLELRDYHRAAVIEIGIDEIGAMKQHLDLVAPTAGLLAAIGVEHLEKLIDLKTVTDEECLLLSYLAETGGHVLANLDDPHISDWLDSHKKLAAKIKTYSLTYSLHDKLNIKPPLPGKHNASNLCGAVSIAKLLGLSGKEIEAGIKNFRQPEGRSEVNELSGPIRVVCDYYNANPSSMRAAFALVEELALGRAITVCLGDMLELGPKEEQFHRALAEPLIALGPERVLLFGDRMKVLVDELCKNKFLGTVKHYRSRESLAKDLKSYLKPLDTVLIKGSRSMKMEEVWKIIK